MSTIADDIKALGQLHDAGVTHLNRDMKVPRRPAPRTGCTLARQPETLTVVAALLMARPRSGDSARPISGGEMQHPRR